MQWRIKPVLPVTKGMGAVAVVVLAVAFAGRDPVRWAAGRRGRGRARRCGRCAISSRRSAWRRTPTASRWSAGFARRRHLPWAQIERVRVDCRTRRGLRSELLELDAGESIYLFSAHELGAMPEEVAAALADLRMSPS